MPIIGYDQVIVYPKSICKGKICCSGEAFISGTNIEVASMCNTPDTINDSF